MEPKWDIKIFPGMTKKYTNENIKKDLGGRDKMTVNSRVIMISRIVNNIRRWVAKIFSTWFYNMGRPSNLPKGWFRMICIIVD